jgi:hypothetical protein
VLPGIVKRWRIRLTRLGLVGTRSALQAYLHVLGDSMGRLVLQGLYFALLVNALSLADYGVFASALAASIIIANVGAFGFTAPLFRGATTRRRLLPWYLGAFLAWTALVAPLSVGLATVFHMAVMDRYIGLTAFLAIAISEAILAADRLDLCGECRARPLRSRVRLDAFRLGHADCRRAPFRIGRRRHGRAMGLCVPRS